MSSSEEAEWNDDDDAEDDDANGENDEEDEGDDEDYEKDDDDEQDKKPEVKKVSKPTEEENDDDDDSEDDDIPLSALIKPKKAASSPRKRKATASKTSNGSSTKKKTKATKKKAPPPPPPTKKKSSSKSYEYASAALYGTDCDKGLLIQRLLCRWWYAYEWPSATIRNAKPPSNYDTLDGFPGVFICTKGDEVGKIMDTRSREDAKRKPSFQNFAQLPADDLRELLLTALEKQQKQLSEADPELSKEIKSLVKWATKLNTKKADKDAQKILTAHGLVLEGES